MQKRIGPLFLPVSVRPVVRTLAVVIIFLCCALPALAQKIVYSNDFESGAGSEWSKTATEITPFGARRFLGQLGDESVTLKLNNLPAHRLVTVYFDLYLLRTWDGSIVVNAHGNVVGPDIWRLSADGKVVFNTTFSNWAHNESADDPVVGQAYPGAFPGGFEGRTGAAENNTLGYRLVDDRVQDSVYHLAFAIPHKKNSVALDFAAIGIQPLSDESWGLDNVRVEISGTAATPVRPRRHQHTTLAKRAVKVEQCPPVRKRHDRVQGRTAYP